MHNCKRFVLYNPLKMTVKPKKSVKPLAKSVKPSIMRLAKAEKLCI